MRWLFGPPKDEVETTRLIAEARRLIHSMSAAVGARFDIDDTAWIDVPSPFAASHLRVRVVPVSTRQADRVASLDTLVAAMARQFTRQPGNYLAYFSSFDYMEQACERIGQSHAQIPVWTQARQMDESARRAFLQRFDAAGQGIAFAVLGGVEL